MLLQRDRQFFVVSTLRTTLSMKQGAGVATSTSVVVKWSNGAVIVIDSSGATIAPKWRNGVCGVYHAEA